MIIIEIKNEVDLKKSKRIAIDSTKNDLEGSHATEIEQRNIARVIEKNDEGNQD